MGMLVKGRWIADAEALRSLDGTFQPQEGRFRSWITPDGSSGPTGEAGFKAEAGRYHLYIARACPYAQRAVIFRVLKKLEPLIGLSVTHWLLDNNGWSFAPDTGVVADTVNGTAALHELYSRADPGYSGRATVPVLWDKLKRTIVSNESADIARMFNSAFVAVAEPSADYYPETLRAEIDELNDFIYQSLTNGVYRAGFAESQLGYEDAVKSIFAALDLLEERLTAQAFLLADQPTEADWRLLPTLVRFDPVYVTHFKCNLRRLIDYPRLYAYARRLLQIPGIAATFDMSHIRKTYYLSHKHLNPSGLVAVGFPSLVDELPKANNTV